MRYFAALELPTTRGVAAAVDDKLAIYQLHVQSADKLDERRDASVRAFGALCVIPTTVAVDAVERFPLPSAVL